MQRREIAVVGGGLAGTATALGFADAGFDTILIAPEPPADRRSTALIGRSVAYLAELGLMDELEAAGEALATMRLVDDTGRLLRAPTVEFRASDIGLRAFGYNILNSDLHRAFERRTAENAKLEVVNALAGAMTADGERSVLTLDDGRQFAVSLVVAADGRSSPLREMAGISVRRWNYPQSAVVLNFAHTVAHRSVSTEFHRRTGPFTQVPLSKDRSSLVWVEDPSVAELLVDLKPEHLSRRVEEKMHSILGKVEVEDGVQRFPLSGGSVARLTDERLALVGEAAHVFPPIGAQGLNLGLRDSETIVRLASESRDDPGRRTTLARYEAARRADVQTRTVGVDLLNRSLLAGFLPAQLARAAGLSAMRNAPFLRNFAMREGLSPGSGIKGLPRALRQRMGADRSGSEDR